MHKRIAGFAWGIMVITLVVSCLALPLLPDSGRSSIAELVRQALRVTGIRD